jgi:hypothetical protein
MHGVIEPEQNLVKLTSDDVQQNCAVYETAPLPSPQAAPSHPFPYRHEPSHLWSKICNTRIPQSISGFPPKWRRMLSMATRPASIFGIKAPMTHKYCYEALDRILQDVMDRPPSYLEESLLLPCIQPLFPPLED